MADKPSSKRAYIERFSELILNGGSIHIPAGRGYSTELSTRFLIAGLHIFCTQKNSDLFNLNEVLIEYPNLSLSLIFTH
jgi:hypothetical protein